MSISKLELQKSYLRDQHNPAINVHEFEVDQFKTVV